MQIDNEQMRKKSKGGFGLDRTGKGIPAIVIDDEFIDRRIIVQILRSVEFNVISEASNGAEGIQEFKYNSPKLVILDMHMPDTSGLDVLLEIKRMNPQTVVVICTSDSSIDTVTPLLENGADDYIVKPIDRTQFLYKLEKLILRKSLKNK